MFLRQQITSSDPRLEIVREHFRSNLLAIAQSAANAGAHTLLCTVLTNQRDFAPFMSRHRARLAGEDLTSWNERFDAAKAAERSGNLAAAESAYRRALEIDDQYAELVFRLGRLLLQTGRDAEARPLLQRALDLDTLRFRADSSLNAVIKNLAGTPPPNSDVVDLASAIAAHSSHGVLGDEQLYEHVHLTLRGTYEVARELFGPISDDLRRHGIVGGTTPEVISYSAARLRLAFTAYEQAMIAVQLTNRFRSPPFTGQADHTIRLETWERLSTSASALLDRPDALSALGTIYHQAMLFAPDDWILARNAGAMYVARKAPEEALPLLERAAMWIDDDVDTLVPLGWAHQALGHTKEAETVFAKARQLEPRYPGLPKTAQ